MYFSKLSTIVFSGGKKYSENRFHTKIAKENKYAGEKSISNILIFYRHNNYFLVFSRSRKSKSKIIPKLHAQYSIVLQIFHSRLSFFIAEHWSNISWEIMCAAVNSSPPPQVTLSHSALKSAKKCKFQGASIIYLPKNNQCYCIFGG